MGPSKERPSTGVPVNTKQSKEILQKLLDIELERLGVACRIEKERNIVFPETTIIIRDIQKLSAAINGKQTNPLNDFDLLFDNTELGN